MDVVASSLKRARAFAPQLVALCLLCAPPPAAAQDVSPAQGVLQTTEGGAHKWDEYGHIGHCDMGARLDNFANLLQENPTAIGYLVGYDPAKGSPGIAKRSLEMQRQYLVGTRAVAGERVFTVPAGRHEGEQLKVELWIVPPGAQPPAEARPAEAETPFSGLFASFTMFDDSSFDHSEEMVGPGSMSIRRGAFVDTLKRQPDSKAYLVAYADSERAPGAWRRFASSEKMMLEAMGVEPSRVVILNGGSRKESEVDFWIVAADAPPPVKAKKREKRLLQAAMIGSYQHFSWRDDADGADEHRWLLDNLAEMLREDKQRVACLVVFQEDDEAPIVIDEAEGEAETPFDYVKLAGEWQRALTERYGIEAHRVVLLIGRAGETQGSSVETWIVPKGVALPDPAEIVRRRDAEMEAGGEEKP